MTIYKIKYFLKNEVENGDYTGYLRMFSSYEKALASIETCRDKHGGNFQLAIMYEMREVNGEFSAVRDWRF